MALGTTDFFLLLATDFLTLGATELSSSLNEADLLLLFATDYLLLGGADFLELGATGFFATGVWKLSSDSLNPDSFSLYCTDSFALKSFDLGLAKLSFYSSSSLSPLLLATKLPVYLSSSSTLICLLSSDISS